MYNIRLGNKDSGFQTINSNYYEQKIYCSFISLSVGWPAV